MPTESTIYEEHLINILNILDAKMTKIENQGHLDDTDVMELQALEALRFRIDLLDFYDA